METKGQRLRRLRKEKRKTLQELSNEVNMSFSGIAMIERDERTYTTDALYMFSKYFNVSVDYLMCKTDDTGTADDIKVAFYNQKGIVTPDQIKEVENFIEYVKSKK